MNEYQISTDYLEIIAGTDNRISRAYTEAAKNISEDNSKSAKYLKNFLTSVESLASKSSVKDAAITASKGNLKEYSGYENIQTAIEFLKKNLGSIPMFSNLLVIHDTLISYYPQYSDGYKYKSRLVMIEFECGVYLLVSGLAFIMCNNIDLAQSGSKIIIKKKSAESNGTLGKIISDFAKEIRRNNHREYLNSMNKLYSDKPINTSADEPEQKPTKKKLEKQLNEYGITVIDDGLNGISIDVFKEDFDEEKLNNLSKLINDFAVNTGSDYDHYESTYVDHYNFNGDNIKIESMVYVESIVGDVLTLLDTGVSAVNKGINLTKTAIKGIKGSLFGIVPLIRSVLFLRYKKKADKINSLEQQIQYIKMNIEQLQNRQGDMSEEKKASIIKKQEAVIAAYKKRAEKLRAEFAEEEKGAASSINSENPSMGKTNDDDDFVLEGMSISDIFGINEVYTESWKDKYKEAPMPDEIKKRYQYYDDIERELGFKIPSSVKLSYALKANLLYKSGSDDTSVDVIQLKSIKEYYKQINDSITDPSSKKYLPVLPIAHIGNGDMDVITKDNKMMYYSHDSKKALQSNKTSDPEKMYFVDNPNAKYDKKKNKTIYIDTSKGEKSDSPLN